MSINENNNDIKQLLKQLDSLVEEYLEYRQYDDTLKCFQAEKEVKKICNGSIGQSSFEKSLLGRYSPRSVNFEEFEELKKGKGRFEARLDTGRKENLEVTVKKLYESTDRVRDEIASNLMEALCQGESSHFWRLWNRYIQVPTSQNIGQGSRISFEELTFKIYLHFAVWGFRLASDDVESNVFRTELQMNEFTEYIARKEVQSEFKENSPLSVYFALPNIDQPNSHGPFSELFEIDRNGEYIWVNVLKRQLIEAFPTLLKDIKEPNLIEIFRNQFETTEKLKKQLNLLKNRGDFYKNRASDLFANCVHLLRDIESCQKRMQDDSRRPTTVVEQAKSYLLRLNPAHEYCLTKREKQEGTLGLSQLISNLNIADMKQFLFSCSDQITQLDDKKRLLEALVCVTSKPDSISRELVYRLVQTSKAGDFFGRHEKLADTTCEAAEVPAMNLLPRILLGSHSFIDQDSLCDDSSFLLATGLENFQPQRTLPPPFDGEEKKRQPGLNFTPYMIALVLALLCNISAWAIGKQYLLGSGDIIPLLSAYLNFIQEKIETLKYERIFQVLECFIVALLQKLSDKQQNAMKMIELGVLKQAILSLGTQVEEVRPAYALGLITNLVATEQGLAAMRSYTDFFRTQDHDKRTDSLSINPIDELLHILEAKSNKNREDLNLATCSIFLCIRDPELATYAVSQCNLEQRLTNASKTYPFLMKRLNDIIRAAIDVSNGNNATPCSGSTDKDNDLKGISHEDLGKCIPSAKWLLHLLEPTSLTDAENVLKIYVM